MDTALYFIGCFYTFPKNCLDVSGFVATWHTFIFDTTWIFSSWLINDIFDSANHRHVCTLGSCFFVRDADNSDVQIDYIGTVRLRNFDSSLQAAADHNPDWSNLTMMMKLMSHSFWFNRTTFLPQPHLTPDRPNWPL